MNHEELKDLIFELYDGELRPSRKREAEEHMAACRECREALEGWKRASSLYLKPLEKSVSKNFTERVMERLEEEALEPQKWYLPNFTPQLAWASAFCVLLLGTGITLIKKPIPEPMVAIQTEETLQYAQDLMETITETEEASPEEAGIQADIEEYFL